MKPLLRVAALTVSGLLLAASPTLAPAATASTDSAAATSTVAAAASPQADERAKGRKFVTIKTFLGAKQQACKQLTKNKRNYKVFTRVVTGPNAVGVGLLVFGADGDVVERAETPITRPRRTSKPVSLKFPATKTDLELAASQFQANAGSGGPVKIKKIATC